MGLKSPSDDDVAAVLDSYQEQVSDRDLFCLLPKHITCTLTASPPECFRRVCVHVLRSPCPRYTLVVFSEVLITNLLLLIRCLVYCRLVCWPSQVGFMMISATHFSVLESQNSSYAFPEMSVR